MKDLIDNTNMEQILEKLESLEDEQLAVSLLFEFNERTKKSGELLMNKDDSLSHAEWKKLCDEAKVDVDEIIKKIRDL